MRNLLFALPLLAAFACAPSLHSHRWAPQGEPLGPDISRRHHTDLAVEALRDLRPRLLRKSVRTEAPYNLPEGYEGPTLDIAAAQQLAAELQRVPAFRRVGLARPELSDGWTQSEGLEVLDQSELVLIGDLRAGHGLGLGPSGMAPQDAAHRLWWLTRVARLGKAPASGALRFGLMGDYLPVLGRPPATTPDGWGGAAILSPLLVIDRQSGAIVWVGEGAASVGLGAGPSDPFGYARLATQRAIAEVVQRLTREAFDVVNARSAIAMIQDPALRPDRDAAERQVRWQASYGRPDVALALATAIDHHWPGRAPVRAARGIAAWRAGDPALALAELSWAATWGGGDGEVFYALARALAQQGDDAKAQSWLGQACARGLAAACPPATARSIGL